MQRWPLKGENQQEMIERRKPYVNVIESNVRRGRSLAIPTGVQKINMKANQGN